MAIRPLRDLYLGASLGLATGDALGTPHKGRQRHQLEREHPRGVREMMDSNRAGVKAGEWGPHNAQALMMLQSYQACRGFEGEDAALRMAEMADADLARLDPRFREITSHFLEDPESWRSVGRDTWYQSGGTFDTNGALARCIPAALFRAFNLERMIEETIAISQVTHFDPRAVEAALAINFLIVQCLHDEFRPDFLPAWVVFIENLKDDPAYKRLALDYDEDVLASHANPGPFASYPEDPDAVSRELQLVEKMPLDDLGTSHNVIHTMQAAVWALFHSDHFDEGVSAVVSLGGDTDAQGALAGALLGARFGFNEIPVAWLKVLHDRPRIINTTELLISQVDTSIE